MADNAKPAAPEENAAGTAAAPAAGGIKALLPLILSVVLMPVIAFAMTKFVLIPQLQKGLVVKAATPGDHAAGGGHGEKKKEAGNAKRESVPLNKLLVNVSGTMGARFLLVSLSVSGTGGEEFKKKMEEHDAQLKDMATSALSLKTIADLERPNARNLIRTELITGFNNILGEPMVQEIYFTEFAIQ
ncbi:MAG: flagellar basal body-associated FliL family protein [Verrucomicrobiota bacterium]